MYSGRQSYEKKRRGHENLNKKIIDGLIFNFFMRKKRCLRRAIAVASEGRGGYVARKRRRSFVGLQAVCKGLTHSV